MIQKKSSVFVTGHKGLVGSAIVRKLTDQGYKNIITITKGKLDLRNQKEVFNFFQKKKIDAVINAAGYVGGIFANSKYKADFIYDNLAIQNNIIHACYKNKIKSLIFLGSSCIYPKNSKQPIKEKYLLTGELEKTNEPYAIAKIAGIKMCENYYRQYGSNFISVMPTNLYGPNDNFNLETSHVLPAIIRKIHLAKCLENNDWDAIRKDLDKNPIEDFTGKALDIEIIAILEKYGIKSIAPSLPRSVVVILWGTGTPKREFLFVDDMAEACVHLMLNYNDKQFVNIGCGVDISIKKLADMVKKIVGYEGELVFDASKPDGTLRKLLDVSNLFKTGWKPSIILESGIKQVYDNYRLHS